MTSNNFAALLLDWYDQQGRKSLPWRLEISPYRVWVSEIMLQQTQVKTVIPYYTRFMARFPRVEDLAVAHQDDVLSLWTGLGYYARGRNLHRAAQKIMQEWGGKFPDTVEELQNLPGVGRSTAGAISAIAWNQRAPILDGNVKRVLIRQYALEEEGRELEKKLWELADALTPSVRVGDYTQAIMDLGATVCTRTKPICEICPVNKECLAHQQRKTPLFPKKKVKKVTPVRSVKMVILHDVQENKVLLYQRPPVGIWGSLWSFPECAEEEDLDKWCAEKYHVNVCHKEILPTFKHIFSHFQLYITPVYIKHEAITVIEVRDDQRYVWHSLEECSSRGFAAPVKRLLNAVSRAAIPIGFQGAG